MSEEATDGRRRRRRIDGPASRARVQRAPRGRLRGLSPTPTRTAPPTWRRSTGPTRWTRPTCWERCDAVSIAVPTRYHYGVATEAIDRGVNVLVEKPFVSDLAAGEN
ncbi:hypothetical protein BV210_18845 (plasmid) [Halorientalis sp. IM1011]|uniref:Gfo/Idh/MocA family oxidoreductase n=1 Tax=Halorientalis sp. IM1011 TaxID=1932360 RepID=UPI00097CC10E|nr:Gfo/Idh/MocA family oxidoreductase [Halorientalis sp. IM1011]AQL44825.1 hypothetical protein BV210_18845 [Halorientalis sp. IM1011]